MLYLLRLGQQFFLKSQGARAAVLTGGSIATLGLLHKLTQELITNMNAVTPTKVNLVIGIGFLLLASNACFAYKYFQLLNSDGDDEQSNHTTRC